MIGTIMFILAVVGFVFLIMKRNKKPTNAGGPPTGGTTPPDIKDPNTEEQEEFN